MRLHESPNTPFSIVYERFPEGTLVSILYDCNYVLINLTGPSKLIYDNGCNLHSYCLNREPDFFMKTRFFVDKFHWKNHTGKMYCKHSMLFLSRIIFSQGAAGDIILHCILSSVQSIARLLSKQTQH